MSEITTIQLKRTSIIHGDLTYAANLISNIKPEAGEPCIAFYKNALGETDLILVVGTGDDSRYSVISTGSEIIAKKVMIEKDLEDIGNLVSGELAVCQPKKKGPVYFVYLDREHEGQRVVNEVEVPLRIKETITGYSWYVDKDTLKRVDDFPVKEEFEEVSDSVEEINKYIGTRVSPVVDSFNDLITMLNPLVVDIKTTPKILGITGNPQNIKVMVKVFQENADVTKDCIVTIEGEELLRYSNGSWVLEKTIEETYEADVLVEHKLNKLTGRGKVKIEMTWPTIIGKIEYPQGNGEWPEWSADTIEDILQLKDSEIGFIPGEILLPKNETIEITKTLKISEYLLIATPGNEAPKIMDAVSGFPLNKDWAEYKNISHPNKEQYTVLVKKMPVQEDEVRIKIERT